MVDENWNRSFFMLTNVWFLKESTCCTPPLECPFGMRALREQFGHPHICSFGVEGICPMDHICTRSTSNPSRFLCCRPQLRCVAPFVDASTQKTLQCYPGKLMNTAFFFRLLSLSWKLKSNSLLPKINPVIGQSCNGKEVLPINVFSQQRRWNYQKIVMNYIHH